MCAGRSFVRSWWLPSHHDPRIPPLAGRGVGDLMPRPYRFHNQNFAPGRCCRPCELKDSFVTGDRDPPPRNHLCLLSEGHTGACDYIRTCRRSG